MGKLDNDGDCDDDNDDDHDHNSSLLFGNDDALRQPLIRDHADGDCDDDNDDDDHYHDFVDIIATFEM